MGFPKYISLRGTSSLRFKRKEEGYAVYHKDAGVWDVDVKYLHGGLKARTPGEPSSPYTVECEEVTEEEWRKDNAGHL